MEAQPNEVNKTPVTREHEDAVVQNALSSGEFGFQLTPGQSRTINRAASQEGSTIKPERPGLWTTQAAVRRQLGQRSELITHTERLSVDPRGLKRYTRFGNLIFRKVEAPELPTQELKEE